MNEKKIDPNSAGLGGKKEEIEMLAYFVATLGDKKLCLVLSTSLALNLVRFFVDPPLECFSLQTNES